MVPRPLTLLLLAAIACLPRPASAALATRNMQVLAQRNDFPQPGGARAYSACWSYVHSDGREYAVLGVKTGTAIYNVTDPASTYLVEFFPGPVSTWREMKGYRDWIYVSTEGVGPSPPPGIQIIRMTDPEHPVLANTWTGTFVRCHTVSVDTARALLACNGARNAAGYGVGTFILSLADPEHPVELAQWPTGRFLAGVDSQYVHDSMFRGNRLYASCIDAGKVRVFDLSDPGELVEIAAWGYPGGFTHNTWLDGTGSWLYAADEVKGEPLKIFDVSDLAAPKLANTITSDPNACVHNVYVAGQELFLANYSQGVRVLDLQDPAHPAEFAWADTWLDPEGTWVGVWNVSPFYPSGTVIASDFVEGLLVMRPVRDYGVMRVHLVDAATRQPIEGVRVTLTTLGDSLVTPADGIVQFAPNPGTHSVFARKFGYLSGTLTRPIALGVRDTAVLELEPLPTALYHGVVSDAVTGQPLPDVEVNLRGTPLHAHAHADGHYHLPAVPDGDYTVEVHRPGYRPIVFERHIGPGQAGIQNFQMLPAASWDALEEERGWIVGSPGDQAIAGIWTRVVPHPSGGTWESRTPRAPRAEIEHEGHGSPAYPLEVQPGTDHTPAPGTMCFVTGQGTDSTNVWENTVAGGATTLMTPALDLTGLADPEIGFWRWFYSDGGRQDWLAVAISADDGATWTPVDTTRGFMNHWDPVIVRVSDHVTPSATVRLRFVAHGGGATVEAGVDDLSVWDAALDPVKVPPAAAPTRLAFGTPRPNPAPGAVSLSLEVPRAGRLEVEVLDVIGRRVGTLHRGEARAGTLALRWDGLDLAGRAAPAGLYFVRARTAEGEAIARVVRTR